MKKIIQYILLFSFICTPFVSYALFSVTPTETTPASPTSTPAPTTLASPAPTPTPTNTTTTTTSGTSCTGELRTNLADAEACAKLAEQQGAALGYTIDCKVEQLGLAGFTDPTSGKDYILSTACSVNGSTYQYGAYNLAGFTAAPGSNAIVTSVNSGWSILQAELAYQSASTQCGGTVYVVNGAYSCTAPMGTPIATAPGTSLITSTSVDPLVRGTTMLLNTLRSLYERMLSTYKNTYGIDISGIAGGTLAASGSGVVTGGQCYVFSQTLTVGSTGPDVVALTYALVQEGFLTQTTNFFDANVMVAVKRLQEAHATEILTIQGLTQGTGVVGEKTRAYLNSKCIKVPVSSGGTMQPTSTPTPTPTPTPNTCATTASVTAQKTGVYAYTFTKNTDGTYKVQLNNPAYGVAGNTYYVSANYSFNAPNALDLNRQNQGHFNYLVSLPGTAEGNTFYQNMFGSFNNAYYDWNNMITQLNAKIATCGTTVATSTPVIAPIATTQFSPTKVRYIKVSVADWDTLPLALREITVFGPNNTIIKPTVISATDFNVLAYTLPTNLNDGNENTVWMANKTSGEDLQVITYDLGQVSAVQKVQIMNYGFTDTRVFVIEISADGSTYRQIDEVRAQANAPIADKGIVWGIVNAPGSMGPIQY